LHENKLLQSETKFLDQNSARSKRKESNRGKTFCEAKRNVGISPTFPLFKVKETPSLLTKQKI
jgi:hypothetical protein